MHFEPRGRNAPSQYSGAEARLKFRPLRVSRDRDVYWHFRANYLLSPPRCGCRPNIVRVGCYSSQTARAYLVSGQASRDLRNSRIPYVCTKASSVRNRVYAFMFILSNRLNTLSRSCVGSVAFQQMASPIAFS